MGENRGYLKVGFHSELMFKVGDQMKEGFCFRNITGCVIINWNSCIGEWADQ